MGFGVRQPAVAGSFYPDDPEELRSIIAKYLSLVKVTQIELEKGSKLRGLVVPHAGYIYSAPVAAYGYKLLAKNMKTLDRAIILGPSHYASFNGLCESGYDFWETPLGQVKVNEVRKREIPVFPEAHAPEHCLEVQLPFLQSIYCSDGDSDNDLEVVPLLCGAVNAKEAAEIIANKVTGESGDDYGNDKTIVIASSDLSHYNTYDAAVKIDSVANAAVPALDIARFEKDGDACGKSAILTLMHLAKKNRWQGKFLDYRNSGDTAGPKSRVVGYGCYAFYERNVIKE